MMHEIRVNAVKLAFRHAMGYWARMDPTPVRFRKLVDWMEKRDPGAIQELLAAIQGPSYYSTRE